MRAGPRTAACRVGAQQQDTVQGATDARVAEDLPLDRLAGRAPVGGELHQRGLAACSGIRQGRACSSAGSCSVSNAGAAAADAAAGAQRRRLRSGWLGSLAPAAHAEHQCRPRGPATAAPLRATQRWRRVASSPRPRSVPVATAKGQRHQQAAPAAGLHCRRDHALRHPNRDAQQNESNAAFLRSIQGRGAAASVRPRC